jgi:hypothetical protein
MEIKFNERVNEIRWSTGSCGNSGCKDPECVCALCAKPLGISEDDPTHDPECEGCERCDDNVPIIIFRREGEGIVQAAFHAKCFEAVTFVHGPRFASHDSRGGTHDT